MPLHLFRNFQFFKTSVLDVIKVPIWMQTIGSSDLEVLKFRIRCKDDLYHIKIQQFTSIYILSIFLFLLILIKLPWEASFIFSFGLSYIIFYLHQFRNFWKRNLQNLTVGLISIFIFVITRISEHLGYFSSF